MPRRVTPRKNVVNPSSSLTERQSLFVEAFLADPEMNARRAANNVGYKGPMAGYKLLATPLVANAIGKRLREIIDNKKLEREAVLAHLRTALFLDPRDVFRDDWTLKPMSEIPDTVLQCIAEIHTETTFDKETGLPRVNVKVKFMSKDSALTNAMKHLCLIAADPKLANQYNVNLDVITRENFLATVLRDIEETRSQNVIDTQTIERRLAK